MCLSACDIWKRLRKEIKEQLVLTADRPPGGVDHQFYGQDLKATELDFEPTPGLHGDLHGAGGLEFTYR